MENKKVEIKDNDVYVLAQSKSFIMVNDNYSTKQEQKNVFSHSCNL